VDENGNPLNGKKARMYAWGDEQWISEARCDKNEYTGPVVEYEEENSGTESEESDEEFEWYTRKVENETYFVFVNNNRQPF